MDHTTLEARMDRIEAMCAEIARVASGGFEAFAASQDLQAATERRLYAALHSMVNVAGVLVAGRHWGLPSSARDALTILGERAVLDAGLVARLKKAVDLRDGLAHDDLGLTPARVHVQLEGIVRDLREFRSQLESWVVDQTINE